MGLGAFGPSAFGPWTQGGHDWALRPLALLDQWAWKKKNKFYGLDRHLGLLTSAVFGPLGPLFSVFLLVALQIILGFWAFGVVGLGPRSIFGAVGPVGNWVYRN